MHPRAVKLQVFMLGVLLGLMQMGYVLSVQRMLSSTITGYVLILTAWIVGAIAGVNIAWRSLAVPMVLAMFGYYSSHLLLYTAPFNAEFLPVHTAFAATGGVLGGSVFRVFQPRFARVREMLFHENNGFLAGIVFAILGTLLNGFMFLLIAPVGVFCLSGLLARLTREVHDVSTVLPQHEDVRAVVENGRLLPPGICPASVKSG